MAKSVTLDNDGTGKVNLGRDGCKDNGAAFVEISAIFTNLGELFLFFFGLMTIDSMG